MTIKTNNRPRDILNWWDLTPKEQKEFDYIDTEDRQSGCQFFRYRNFVYDLGEFMICTEPIAPHPQREGWEKWDGYISDSFFSGILIKYVNDWQQVIVGTFFS